MTLAVISSALYDLVNKIMISYLDHDVTKKLSSDEKKARLVLTSSPSELHLEALEVSLVLYDLNEWLSRKCRYLGQSHYSSIKEQVVLTKGT